VQALFSLSMTGGVHHGDLSQASAPLAVCAADAGEALERARALAWTAGEALARRALAGICSAQARAGEAVALIRESARLAESVDHRSHMLRGHGVMGEVLLDIRDTVGARRHLERAIELSGQVGSAAAATPTELRLVEVDTAQGRLDDAGERIDAVISDLPEHARRLAAGAHAELLLASGEPAAALDVVRTALRSLPNDESDTPPVRIGYLRGRALADVGCHDEAAQALLTADLRAHTGDAPHAAQRRRGPGTRLRHDR
jgi:tetratricopeptide (TPR) repeat protein